MIISYRDIRISRNLADTYSEIIHSQIALEEVITNLSLPYSVEQLRANETFSIEDIFEGPQTIVRAKAVPNTELIIINVTSPDPHPASDIANEVANVSIDKVYENMNIENIKVIDEALTPNEPVSPRVYFNITMAFLISMMFSLSLVYNG